MTHDLLHDPLIQSDRGWHSLPGLMVAMVRGEVAGFPALRPHQRPAWHMFLVQLAVMVLDAAGIKTLPEGEGDWRVALSALTPDFPDGEPWHLVVPDRSRPAFMQPPDPGGLKDWDAVITPDALDMVVTARNHDLKSEVMREATPQDWLFSLISLQTMAALGGRANYGIARMNSGWASRPMVALAPARPGSAEINLSTWWSRDVTALLENRKAERGRKLLWIEPWPEGQALDRGTFDSLFIEVSRRIRLAEQAGRLTAERNTSKKPRVNSDEREAYVDDPWAPVSIPNGEIFNLGQGDWSAKVLVDLLFHDPPKWKRPLLASEHAKESAAPMLLVVEAFARRKTTDGFRSRVIPVPKAELLKLLWKEQVSVAEEVISDIADVSKVLRAALFLVASAGDNKKVSENRKNQKARNRLNGYIQPAVDALERQADELFFPELWKRAEARVDDDFRPLRYSFLQELAVIARQEFTAALPSIPCASLTRPRAEVRGRAWLENSLARIMRDLQPEEEAHA